MKCSSIFVLLVSFSSALFASEQFYQQSSNNHQIRIPDIFQSPSFFSEHFTDFEQLKPFLKSSGHREELADSASESSELMPVKVVKNFYFHVAPDDYEPVQPITQKVTSVPRVQSYKVIFIKAPVEQRRTTNADVVNAKRDHKTVVYVLLEKPEVIEIEKVSSQPDPRKFLTPDILFTNHKINDEAGNIRERITAHYGSLQQSNNAYNVELGQRINAMAEYRPPTDIGKNSKRRKKIFRSLRYTNTLRTGVR